MSADEYWGGVTIILILFALAVFVEALIAKWMMGRRWSDWLVMSLVANVVGTIAVFVALAVFAYEALVVRIPRTALLFSATEAMALYLSITCFFEWPVLMVFSRRGWGKTFAVSLVANIVTTTLFVAPFAFGTG
jgi:hypothetical protein